MKNERKIILTDVKVDEVKGIIERVRRNRPDRMFMITKFIDVQVTPPDENRKTHKLTIELEIPEDAFASEDTLHDFGGIILIDIAKNEINPKYLRE